MMVSHLPVHILIHEVFVICFLPCLTEEGEREQLGEGLAASPGKPTTTAWHKQYVSGSITTLLSLQSMHRNTHTRPFISSFVCSMNSEIS